MRRVDSRVKCDGSQKFGLDLDVPGMKVALVAHPPVFGAKIKNFDANAARAIPGVQDVFEIPLVRGSGVAVVAERFWAAKQARDRLRAEWDTATVERPDTAQLFAKYRELARSCYVARSSRQLAVFREQLGCIRALHGGSVPLRSQAVARLLRGPEPLCHHRDSRSPDEWNLKNILHSRNCSRGIRVKVLDLRSEHGRMRHQSDLHSRNIQVEPKLLRAIAFHAAINAAHLLTSQPEIALLLKRNSLGDRLTGSGFCQLCVLCRFSIWSIDQTGFGSALCGRHVPLRGSSGDHHGTYFGAELTVLLKGMRDRA